MTTTPQAALLSDAEIAQCINQSRTNLFDRAGTTSFRIARAIEQALLAKLQPAQAGELPDEREAFDDAWHRIWQSSEDRRQEYRVTSVQDIAWAMWREALAARKPFDEAQVTAAARCICKRHITAIGANEQEAWDFWSDDFKAEAREILQAANAARKPLTVPTPAQLEAEFDRRNEELERVGHGTDVPSDLWDFSIGARFGIEEFCRINGLEVKP